jgi:hypothetical protein
MARSGDRAGRTSLAHLVSLRIGGKVWTQVAELARFGPDDEVYAVEVGQGGTVAIRFGDGTTGARLPTGQDITAEYRLARGKGRRLAITLERSGSTPTEDVALWTAIRCTSNGITFQR